MNDPAAFQASFTKEAAEIGKGFAADPDSSEGWVAALAPARQQAFAANTAQVGARMEKDRSANLSLMAVDSISSTQRENGGNAAPAQLEAALEPMRLHHFATGGTNEDWGKVVYQAFTTAAYNSQDPDLLDKLPKSIANLPGIADGVSSDKYRILQSRNSKLRMAAQDARDEVTIQSQQIFGEAVKRYGLGLFNGSVTAATLMRDNPKASPLAIAGALNTVQASTADNQSLYIANQRSWEQGQGAAIIRGLHQEAITAGYSPALANRVGDLILNGVMPVTDGNSLIEKALSTTHAAQPKSDMFGSSTERQKDTQRTAQTFGILRGNIGADVQQMVQHTNSAARVGGTAGMTPEDSKALNGIAINAATQYLATHTGDVAGARKAAREAAGNWMMQNLGRFVEGKVK
jgi:hypothetical protein